MSNYATVYLIIGVKINPTEWGIDLWDNKWLPQMEGHGGIDMQFYIDYTSEVENIYIGKCLTTWCQYDREIDFECIPNSEDFTQVNSWLQREIGYTGPSASLRMFTIWG